MLPSERAKAAGAPVEPDIGKLEPGTLLTIEWQGKPVWILRRTERMLRLLGAGDQQLSDPQSEVPQQPAYCKNSARSIKPEYLVSLGLCTHLGWVPGFRPDIAPADQSESSASYLYERIWTHHRYGLQIARNWIRKA